MTTKENLLPAIAGALLVLTGEVLFCLFLLGYSAFLLLSALGMFTAAYACLREIKSDNINIKWVASEKKTIALLLDIGIFHFVILTATGNMNTGSLLIGGYTIWLSAFLFFYKKLS